MHARAACIVLLSILAPALAQAWGSEGHRIVAHLAEPLLSATARAEIDRLLAGQPEPTLAGISNWADAVRDTPQWRHTTRWHWVNLPAISPCQFDAERDCPQGDCIILALREQRRILADPDTPDLERRIALQFVVHLVGDLHQPFHAGFAFDRGGNDTRLRFARQNWNLHVLWDVAMVEQAGLEPEVYAAQLRNTMALPATGIPLADDPEVSWALESCQAIHDHRLYPQGTRIGRGYLERHRPLAEQRLKLAGARLATLLNQAFEPQNQTD